VQVAGAFAVGFVDFVEGGGGRDADEGVEGAVGAFGGDYFGLEVENFVVYER